MKLKVVELEKLNNEICLKLQEHEKNQILPEEYQRLAKDLGSANSEKETLERDLVASEKVCSSLRTKVAALEEQLVALQEEVSG